MYVTKTLPENWEVLDIEEGQAKQRRRRGRVFGKIGPEREEESRLRIQEPMVHAACALGTFRIVRLQLTFLLEQDEAFRAANVCCTHSAN